MHHLFERLLVLLHLPLARKESCVAKQPAESGYADTL